MSKLSTTSRLENLSNLGWPQLQAALHAFLLAQTCTETDLSQLTYNDAARLTHSAALLSN